MSAAPAGPADRAVRAAGAGGRVDTGGATGAGGTGGTGGAPARTPTARPRARRSWAATLGRAVGYLVLVAIAVIYLYPFFIQIVTSVKTNPDASNNPLSLVPNPFTTDTFGRLADADFPLWFVNSVWVTLVVTAGRVLFDSLAGYALARVRFSGSRWLFAGVLAVLAVPPVVLLIPKFLVLKQLGMYDTPAGLAVPLIADAAGIFIMKQFFESVPPSIEEAARVDGASTPRLFWSIVLPMARPALITVTIISFQGSWNELPHFIVASQSEGLFTLTKGVATLTTGQLGSGNQFPLTLAAALLMTIPVAVVFFCFQRYFVRSATEGAIKG
jgi:multiple sugar transport system permease protein